ncbi:MAG: LPS export ABC transporter periplasmic protein LptC [Geobacteraceae bacterium]|nr:LPS export ABC transporter periplasmic protein LptC [Geobacteraceae bacterium]
MQKFNKIKQVLAVVVIVAASYLMVVIALKYHRLKGPADMLSDLPKNIDLSLQKVHYTNTKDGVLQWDLLARKVDYYNDSGVIRFAQPEMVLFSKGGSENYTLKADTADYHKKSGDVMLVGNITATSESGMTFSTGHLDYNSSRSLVSTDDHVRLEDTSLSVEGTGMELRVDSRNVRVLHNVTAVITTRKK